MENFKKILIEAKHRNEAILVKDSENRKSKDEYISTAQEGLIIAFRLNFKATNKDIKLTKVISGKIDKNDREEKMLLILTANGLRYAVPYSSVLWVKTGERWPRGVYEEMRKGAVPVGNETEETFIEVVELNGVNNAPQSI